MALSYISNPRRSSHGAGRRSCRRDVAGPADPWTRSPSRPAARSAPPAPADTSRTIASVSELHSNGPTRSAHTPPARTDAGFGTTHPCLDSTEAAKVAAVARHLPQPSRRRFSTRAPESQPRRCLGLAMIRRACATATRFRAHPGIGIENLNGPVSRRRRPATPAGHRKPARAEELPAPGADAGERRLAAFLDRRRRRSLSDSA